MRCCCSTGHGRARRGGPAAPQPHQRQVAAVLLEVDPRLLVALLQLRADQLRGWGRRARAGAGGRRQHSAGGMWHGLPAGGGHASTSTHLGLCNLDVLLRHLGLAVLEVLDRVGCRAAEWAGGGRGGGRSRRRRRGRSPAAAAARTAFWLPLCAVACPGGAPGHASKRLQGPRTILVGWVIPRGLDRRLHALPAHSAAPLQSLPWAGGSAGLGAAQRLGSL